MTPSGKTGTKPRIATGTVGHSLFSGWFPAPVFPSAQQPNFKAEPRSSLAYFFIGTTNTHLRQRFVSTRGVNSPQTQYTCTPGFFCFCRLPSPTCGDRRAPSSCRMDELDYLYARSRRRRFALTSVGPSRLYPPTRSPPSAPPTLTGARRKVRTNARASLRSPRASLHPPLRWCIATTSHLSPRTRSPTRAGPTLTQRRAGILRGFRDLSARARPPVRVFLSVPAAALVWTLRHRHPTRWSRSARRTCLTQPTSHLYRRNVLDAPHARRRYGLGIPTCVVRGRA
ncbi:hypothetical protein C8J57DRAFT_1307395, partial [Mycena rebaudengoi]